MTRAIALVSVILMTVPLLSAQAPQPIGENLLRLEGTDGASGIHYLKFISLLKPADSTTPAESVPRFTMECREQAGKRSLHWLVRFTFSADFRFQPPPVAAGPGSFPAKYPNAQLAMRFEGYTRSEPFKRQWEILPTGELHYRNPGFGSTNLDDPRHFMPWLASLPSIRIVYVKDAPQGTPKELVFPLKPLLEEVAKAALCQP